MEVRGDTDRSLCLEKVAKTNRKQFVSLTTAEDTRVANLDSLNRFSPILGHLHQLPGWQVEHHAFSGQTTSSCGAFPAASGDMMLRSLVGLWFLEDVFN